MIDPPRLLAALLFGVAALLAAPPASAQAWKPDKNVEIVVGLTAGSNQDRTARTLQKIWQDAKLRSALTDLGLAKQ